MATERDSHTNDDLDQIQMANNERKAAGTYLSVVPCAKTRENEL